MEEARQEATVHNDKGSRKCNAHNIDIQAHVGVYIMVNVFLLVVWKLSKVQYPWPLWVIAGWGVGLAGHIFGRYLGRQATR